MRSASACQVAALLTVVCSATTSVDTPLVETHAYCHYSHLSVQACLSKHEGNDAEACHPALVARKAACGDVNLGETEHNSSKNPTWFGGDLLGETKSAVKGSSFVHPGTGEELGEDLDDAGPADDARPASLKELVAKADAANAAVLNALGNHSGMQTQKNKDADLAAVARTENLGVETCIDFSLCAGALRPPRT